MTDRVTEQEALIKTNEEKITEYQKLIDKINDQVIKFTNDKFMDGFKKIYTGKIEYINSLISICEARIKTANNILNAYQFDDSYNVLVAKIEKLIKDNQTYEAQALIEKINANIDAYTNNDTKLKARLNTKIQNWLAQITTIENKSKVNEEVKRKNILIQSINDRINEINKLLEDGNLTEENVNMASAYIDALNRTLNEDKSSKDNSLLEKVLEKKLEWDNKIEAYKVTNKLKVQTEQNAKVMESFNAQIEQIDDLLSQNDIIQAQQFINSLDISTTDANLKVILENKKIEWNNKISSMLAKQENENKAQIIKQMSDSYKKKMKEIDIYLRAPDDFKVTQAKIEINTLQQLLNSSGFPSEELKTLNTDFEKRKNGWLEKISTYEFEKLSKKKDMSQQEKLFIKEQTNRISKSTNNLSELRKILEESVAYIKQDNLSQSARTEIVSIIDRITDLIKVIDKSNETVDKLDKDRAKVEVNAVKRKTINDVDKIINEMTTKEFDTNLYNSGMEIVNNAITSLNKYRDSIEEKEKTEFLNAMNSLSARLTAVNQRKLFETGQEKDNKTIKDLTTRINALTKEIDGLFNTKTQESLARCTDLIKTRTNFINDLIKYLEELNKKLSNELSSYGQLTGKKSTKDTTESTTESIDDEISKILTDKSLDENIVQRAVFLKDSIKSNKDTIDYYNKLVEATDMQIQIQFTELKLNIQNMFNEDEWIKAIDEYNNSYKEYSNKEIKYYEEQIKTLNEFLGYLNELNTQDKFTNEMEQFKNNPKQLNELIDAYFHTLINEKITDLEKKKESLFKLKTKRIIENNETELSTLDTMYEDLSKFIDKIKVPSIAKYYYDFVYNYYNNKIKQIEISIKRVIKEQKEVKSEEAEKSTSATYNRLKEAVKAFEIFTSQFDVIIKNMQTNYDNAIGALDNIKTCEKIDVLKNKINSYNISDKTTRSKFDKNITYTDITINNIATECNVDATKLKEIYNSKISDVPTSLNTITKPEINIKKVIDAKISSLNRTLKDSFNKSKAEYKSLQTFWEKYEAFIVNLENKSLKLNNNQEKEKSNKTLTEMLTEAESIDTTLTTIHKLKSYLTNIKGNLDDQVFQLIMDRKSEFEKQLDDLINDRFKTIFGIIMAAS